MTKIQELQKQLEELQKQAKPFDDMRESLIKQFIENKEKIDSFLKVEASLTDSHKQNLLLDEISALAKGQKQINQEIKQIMVQQLKSLEDYRELSIKMFENILSALTNKEGK